MRALVPEFSAMELDDEQGVGAEAEENQQDVMMD